MRLSKRFAVQASALALTTIVATGAFAAVDVLNFAGLNGNAREEVLGFYDGGTGSLGSGPGANYGISFGAGALACSGLPGGSCNTAEIPGGPGANTIFFLSGIGDVMNVAAGFTTGFSFYYSAAFQPGIVNVYSGLNNTGTLLASLTLPVTASGAAIAGCEGTDFCPYTAVGVTFSGTARSVDFSGTADQIGFADITLGSADAGGVPAVPEPSTYALMLLGLGSVAYWARRRSAR